MHRFYIAPNEWNPDALLLSEAEAHHARNVLRLQPGAKAVLFNGRGCEVTAEIVSSDSGGVALRKIHQNTTSPLRCRITLGQAIPKGKNMDLIVQKAVELGAAEIVPIISDRTIVRLDEKEAAQKQAKWQTIAIEAAKQSGQNWLPEVQTPRTLTQFFSASPIAAVYDRRGEVPPVAAVYDRRGEVRTRELSVHREQVESVGAHRAPLQAAFDLQLIGSLQSDALHLKKILSDHSTGHGALPRKVLMLIGPEGDFTPAELNLARAHGCLPITLGPIILRVETAAIYCLSVLSYELLA